MANTSLLQVRVDPEDRTRASCILESLGTNLSAVVNMMIKQIIITEGIPFNVQTRGKDEGNVVREKANEKSEIEIIPAETSRIISAIEYAQQISLIPEGYVGRFEDINRYFETKYQVEHVEPDFTGWPAYDNNGREIPYWRMIGSRGAVTGVYRYDAKGQYEKLLSEGIILVPYRKSFRVVDYKKYLFRFEE